MSKQLEEIREEYRIHNSALATDMFIEEVEQALETLSSLYDENTSVEYNIAYLKNTLSLMEFDFGDYVHQIVMAFLTNEGK